ncbi:hypothetical protein [Streptomyces sp. 039-1]|uniref:hypothetical protein n=1 Tax=Streptomyces sp. 039-1 TaxID=2789263 RepID=UPI0039F4A4E1
MTDETTISRLPAGFYVTTSAGDVDTVATLKEFAKWVIDHHDYYLGQDDMRELVRITDAGGGVEVEFPGVDGKSLSVTVMQVR